MEKMGYGMYQKLFFPKWRLFEAKIQFLSKKRLFFYDEKSKKNHLFKHCIVIQEENSWQN